MSRFKIFAVVVLTTVLIGAAYAAPGRGGGGGGRGGGGAPHAVGRGGHFGGGGHLGRGRRIAQPDCTAESECPRPDRRKCGHRGMAQRPGRQKRVVAAPQRWVRLGRPAVLAVRLLRHL